MRTAFALTDESPLHPEPIVVDDVAYLIRLGTQTVAPAEIPASDYDALHTQLQRELGEAVVGAQAARMTLVLNQPGEYVGFVRSVLDEAVASGDLVVREELFLPPDPVEEL